MSQGKRTFALTQPGLALLALACSGTPHSTSSTGGSSASCAFSIITNTISSKMPTVGIVEWSTTLTNLARANIVYALNGASSSVLNQGGTAPVDLAKSNHRTLLLGLKPSSDYTFHIEATDVHGAVCKSSDYALPTTGSFPASPTFPTGVPSISRTAVNPSAQAKGFIVTSSGMTYGDFAIIIDADGTVVWFADGPTQCTRAHIDYEGTNMWMLAANEENSTGEMRFVSMDGQTTMNNIPGLSDAHHDFTVLPGKIAALSWANGAMDAESNLVEINSDGSGSATTVFKIGSNLYVGGPGALGAGPNSYHSNSILYHTTDDSFTIGDRDPSLYVKVSHAGAVKWQFGGSCSNAPAGASHCVPGSWQVNHGHHLLDNGTLLIFDNENSGPSHVLQFKLNTSGSMSATSIKDFTFDDIFCAFLGDVQRLPNGNTLITYSTASEVLEVDPSWNTVQTLTGIWGYADWRETLYGPPSR
jgi:hypothetical protein